MAINNVYNQTPKRIFTNKPFVKGMSYTNADMQPYVCRVVSNLEMDSSNTATHVRQSIHNKYIVSGAEIIKFFDKYLILSNFITENTYRYNYKGIDMTDSNEYSLGIEVKDNAFDSVYSIYDYILYNDTDIHYDTKLSHSGTHFCKINDDGYAIFVLKLNDGTVPYCINSNNKSLSFFGQIYSTQSGLRMYSGLITTYFHAAADKVIIEVNRPTIVSPEDVTNYGVNIIADNPLIYRDYVHFNNGDDTYLDYASGVSDKLIDITTVQVYDSAVDPINKETHSTANLVNGFNKNEEGNIYVRPYVVLPKGNYNAVLKANVSGDLQNSYYYNFASNTFVNDPTFKQLAPSSEDSGAIECITYKYGDGMKRLNNTFASISNFDVSTPCDIEVSSSYNLFSLIPSAGGKCELSSTEMYNKFKTIDIDVKHAKHNLAELCDYVYGNRSWCGSFSGNAATAVNTDFDDIQIDERIIHGMVYPLSQVRFKSKSVNDNFTLTEGKYEVDVPLDLEVRTSFFRNGPQREFKYVHNNNDKKPVGIAVNVKNTFFTYNGDKMPNDTVWTDSLHIYHVNKADINNGNIKWCGINSNIPFENESTVELRCNRYMNATCTAYFTEDTYNSNIVDIEIQCRITVFPSNFSYSYEDVPYLILKLVELMPSYYSFFDVSYTIPNVTGVLKYIVTSVGVTADIDLEALNDIVPGGNISTVCTEYDISDTMTYTADNYIADDTVLSSIPKSVLMDNYKPYEDSDAGYDIYIALPSIKLTDYRYYTSINDTYIKAIQSVGSDNVINSNYNIPIQKNAINNISSTIDNGAVTFTVFIFPKSTYNTIDSADSVQATSAVIKTYEEDILNYNALANETNFKAGIDHIAMHLGHYVMWGKETKSNTLYYSEYNNSAYIPSMYAIDFDKPIVHVHTHQNNLIVFTTDDIYILHSGNVPSTTVQDGSEIPFTKSIIQSNTRLGYNNINTVKSIGKDIFFITDSGDGYLLKTNRYVSDASDTYLIKVTNQIEDLLKNPYEYCLSRAKNYNYNLELAKPIPFSPAGVRYQNSSIDSFQITNDLFNYHTISNTNDITVQDGDTFYYNGTSFRLADVNTPELQSDDRLSVVAKTMLDMLLHLPNKTVNVLYRDDVKDHYGRYIAWVAVGDSDNIIYVNSEMIRLGLAHYYMPHEYSHLITINGELGSVKASEYCNTYFTEAITYNRGIHNNVPYLEQIEGNTPYNIVDVNTYKLFTYATNSYIYIVQSILLDNGKGMTIIYKYNIDSRVWVIYDFIGAVFPVDIVSDSSKTGFAMLCANVNKAFVAQNYSYLTFSNNNIDINEMSGTSNYIHAYFDTGNQALAIMNDKLFREFKLSLGSNYSNNLNIAYNIKMYLDDIEVKNRDKHLQGVINHQNCIDKLTVLAPGRGRVPRFTVDLECMTDVNILEYAIVYLQLNAK